MGSQKRVLGSPFYRGVLSKFRLEGFCFGAGVPFFAHFAQKTLRGNWVLALVGPFRCLERNQVVSRPSDSVPPLSTP